jgi:hypothetical protein
MRADCHSRHRRCPNTLRSRSRPSSSRVPRRIPHRGLCMSRRPRRCRVPCSSRRSAGFRHTCCSRRRRCSSGFLANILGRRLGRAGGRALRLGKSPRLASGSCCCSNRRLAGTTSHSRSSCKGRRRPWTSSRAREKGRQLDRARGARNDFVGSCFRATTRPKPFHVDVARRIAERR